MLVLASVSWMTAIWRWRMVRVGVSVIDGDGDIGGTVERSLGALTVDSASAFSWRLASDPPCRFSVRRSSVELVRCFGLNP